jgi:hypothetical protein
MITKPDASSWADEPLGDDLRGDLSRTRPFQVLALKCLSIYRLTVRTLDDLNSAMLTAL